MALFKKKLRDVKMDKEKIFGTVVQKKILKNIIC